MTTITVITRLYENEDAARAVARRLRRERFPDRAVQIIAPGAGLDRDALEDKMTRARVRPGAAATYADRVAEGAALLVIRATYKPLGAARIAREAVERSETVDAGVPVEEYKVESGPDHAPSVLKDHPRFLTLPPDPEGHRPGLVTSRLGLPLLTQHRRKKSAMSGGGHMSRYFWPGPLIIRRKKATSAISGGRHMSRYFWPMPLVTTRPRKKSVIPGGGHPMSRALGWPTTTRR